MSTRGQQRQEVGHRNLSCPVSFLWLRPPPKLAVSTVAAEAAATTSWTTTPTKHRDLVMSSVRDGRLSSELFIDRTLVFPDDMSTLCVDMSMK